MEEIEPIDYNDAKVKEIVEYFDKRMTIAKWFYTYSEAGDFEVLNRQELLDIYVDLRLKDEPSEELLMEYRGANSFSEAKNNVVMFLKSWSKELRGAYRTAKAIKKGKRK
jgi:hypothetical protein